MKKIYLILFICIAFLGTKATTFTVNISGFTYSPASLTVTIGDQVVIMASSFHPANQVSAATWTAGVSTATMAGGWGSQANTFTFTATTVGTIYYMCQNHGTGGMKGTITVTSTGIGINETAANFLNNYNLFPNPATSNVKVSFGLNETSTVNIKLFNVAGQEVKAFVSDLNLASGNYEYNFELPQSIASGNYFIEVSSGNRKSTKKLLVTK
jgi:plastocyanin